MKGDRVKVLHHDSNAFSAVNARMTVGTMIDWNSRYIVLECEEPGTQKVYTRRIPDHQILYVDEMPREKAEQVAVSTEQIIAILDNDQKSETVRKMYGVLKKYNGWEGPPVNHLRLTPDLIKSIVHSYNSLKFDDGLVTGLLE